MLQKMLFELIIKILVITFVIMIFYYVYRFVRLIWKLKRIGQAVDQFPMDGKHWLLGHTYKLKGQGEESLSYFMELMQKYPKACGLYLINFLRPYVVVYHPETVKVVMKGTGGKPVFLGIYGYAKLLLGDGLIISTGQKWLRNRRLLTPTFHFEALKHYVKYHNQAAEVFLNKLSGYAKSNEAFDIQSLASLLTFDVILRCTFSYESGVQTKGEKHFFTNAIKEITRLWFKRQFEPWKHFDFIYWRTNDGKVFRKSCDTVNNFSKKIINERRKLMKEHPDQSKTYHDFMDILLNCKDEDGIGLTDDEIKDEVNNFVAAGFETTASAISWCLYSFGQYPNYQEICQKEIDQLLRGHPDDYIGGNELPKLNYITKCLNESMRLYGIPLIEREMDKEVVIDGKLVPAGTSVMVHFYSLHRNPDVWENPLKFDPERFSKDKLIQMDPFAFVPFSAGSRNCIGQSFAMDEMKIHLARSLKRFNFTVVENHKPIKSMTATLRSSNGLYLRVSERFSDSLK